MQLKTFLLSALTIALCGTCYAQDKVYKRNGDIIDVKIKSVGIKTVTYVRFDNQTGPEYTIIKNEVEKIVYQNGSQDVFESGRMPRPSRHHNDDTASGAASNRIVYNRNILSIVPIQFSENGLGLGLTYERSLDKKGIIAFYLPVAYTLNLNNGTYYNSVNGAYQNGHQDGMLYVMPGIKVYPTGSNGYVRYAIGPSLVIAGGQKSTSLYDPLYGSYSGYQTQDHFLLGMIVNNSININPTPHVSLGLELGLGFTYLNRVGGLNQDTQGLVQGGFKIGYRF